MQWKNLLPRMDTDEPSAAYAATTDFGLRRESRRAGATPLLEATGSTESGVAAALCHRSPNLCRPCAKLQDCITDRKKDFSNANKFTNQ
jgi:hypothetical protein